MMFIKITPVFRRGASTPLQTGSPELLRVDVIQRVAVMSPAGSGFPCLNIILDDGTSISCTGTINDLIAAMTGPAETFDEPEMEPATEPSNGPDTVIE